jgi:hypothetical protein
MRQPRIKAVSAGARPLHLTVTWADETTSDVDLTELVKELKVFEPLDDNPTAFANVGVGDYGWSVRWSDEVDLGADTLWRMALEQRGDAMRTIDFNAWRERNKLSLAGAAATLGLSRRVVAYYTTGRRIIPKLVLLATKGHETPLPQRVSGSSSVVLSVMTLTAKHWGEPIYPFVPPEIEHSESRSSIPKVAVAPGLWSPEGSPWLQ